MHQFLAFVRGKPINQITVADIQDYEHSLAGSPRTVYRKMAVVKSLFTYANKIGYLLFNVGAVIDLQRPDDDRNQKILPEDEIIKLINSAGENPRNYVLLRVMYNAKLRVSEVIKLTWGDVKDCSEKQSGQLSVLGKGARRRYVLLSAGTYKALMSLRGDAGDEDFIFPSRKGGQLSRIQVHRLVKKYVEIAGVNPNFSAHWFRHSGSSHALDRGCPLPLLRDDLGHSNISVTSIYAHAKPDTGSAEYSVM